MVSSSNSGNQGNAALEIVFHEACHFLTGFNIPLPVALAAAARDAGVTERRDLTHPVHFFMTGEAVRRVLENLASRRTFRTSMRTASSAANYGKPSKRSGPPTWTESARSRRLPPT
jgi:hypothetical protein